MKHLLLGLALATTITTATMAVDARTGKKAKKAKSAACEKGHACCMKKAQA